CCRMPSSPMRRRTGSGCAAMRSSACCRAHWRNTWRSGSAPPEVFHERRSMKSLAKLKDDARRHEQREQWQEAIDLYLKVLRSAEDGETEVELPLYNRVGDLYVRLNRPAEAVRFYEQAADHYADAGLFNNAIALCNKALRYLPNRISLYRKLGRFSARQGFLTDARRWFLDYAEHMFGVGNLDEAFAALEDFAD